MYFTISNRIVFSLNDTLVWVFDLVFLSNHKTTLFKIFNYSTGNFTLKTHRIPIYNKSDQKKGELEDQTNLLSAIKYRNKCMKNVITRLSSITNNTFTVITITIETYFHLK